MEAAEVAVAIVPRRLLFSLQAATLPNSRITTPIVVVVGIMGRVEHDSTKPRAHISKEMQIVLVSMAIREVQVLRVVAEVLVAAIIGVATAAKTTFIIIIEIITTQAAKVEPIRRREATTIMVIRVVVEAGAVVAKVATKIEVIIEIIIVSTDIHKL